MTIPFSFLGMKKSEVMVISIFPHLERRMVAMTIPFSLLSGTGRRSGAPLSSLIWELWEGIE